jgi:hypothetical protein
MPWHSPLPKTRDAQFEWFHELVKSLDLLPRGEVPRSLRSATAGFTAENLPGHSFPQVADISQFKEAVLSLRANERAWNKALQSALFSASEKAEFGESGAAARELELFASGCPWVLFAEVARNQASHFSAPSKP